jgi:hypothetical protein
MNPIIEKLCEKAGQESDSWEDFVEKFSKSLVQDCANFIRESYDDKASESIAWCLEMHYGLHGDYA